MKPQEIHARLRGQFGDAILDWQEPAVGDASISVVAAKLPEVCRFLREDASLQFDYLRMVTGVDRGEVLSSVYHLYSYVHNHDVTLRVDVERAEPRVASVVEFWPSADWHEREAYDMIGIVYEGHPNLHRILLPEDWEGYPLRKDYVAPKEYHGISNE